MGIIVIIIQRVQIVVTNWEIKVLLLPPPLITLTLLLQAQLR